MIYKKTWLSSLLWAVYTCVAGALLAIYTVLFWKKEIGTEIGYYMIAFVAVVLVLVIACYLLISKALSKLGNKFVANKRAALICEIIAVFCIFVGGLIYRIYLYMQSSTALIEVTEYYRAASVNAGGDAELILHGASYLYMLCLSLVLSFFESSLDAAVWMQIFIQMVTLLLAYFTVKKIAGRIAACVTMLMLAVSSIYINKIFDITPECFFFVLYLIGMLALGSYVKSYCRNNLSSKTSVLGAALSGIVIGMLTYLDAASLTLLILLPGLITGVRKSNTDEENNAEENDITENNKQVTSTGFSVLMLGLAIVASGLTLTGVFALDAYACGIPFTNVAKAWLNLYMAHLPVDYMLYQTEYSMIECYVQVIIAVFLVISFWDTPKIQNATPWICMMLLLAPTPLARIGVLPYQVFSIFIWSALAGIGLQQSCILDVNPVTEKDAGETLNEAETTDASKTAGITAADEAPEQSAKPRFIENPLPLPKKHERKEMDFQYEVPADKMKFDIDIKENDDFDI